MSKALSASTSRLYRLPVVSVTVTVTVAQFIENAGCRAGENKANRDFFAVIPYSHRPGHFSGRPRNGHSLVISGVIFLMSAERLRQSAGRSRRSTRRSARQSHAHGGCSRRSRTSTPSLTGLFRHAPERLSSAGSSATRKLNRTAFLRVSPGIAFNDTSHAPAE